MALVNGQNGSRMCRGPKWQAACTRSYDILLVSGSAMRSGAATKLKVCLSLTICVHRYAWQHRGLLARLLVYKHRDHYCLRPPTRRYSPWILRITGKLPRYHIAILVAVGCIFRVCLTLYELMSCLCTSCRRNQLSLISQGCEGYHRHNMLLLTMFAILRATNNYCEKVSIPCCSALVITSTTALPSASKLGGALSKTSLLKAR